MQENYIDFLLKISTKKHYKKGNILFYEGEQAKNFFFLLSGKVRVYKSISNTKELTLHHFYPSNFIAEMPAFKELEYPASAEFELEGDVLEINFKTFRDLCFKNPHYSFLMISSLFEKIKILGEQLTQASSSLKIRFIKYLLATKNLNELSQKNIALDLNVRAESLSRLLKELKNLNLIQTTKGKISIVDKSSLEEELLKSEGL